jgi:hypothetical protein
MAFLGATISRRLYPIPVPWPRIAFAVAAGFVCFFLGMLFGPLWIGALARVGLALGFAAFAWNAILNEADRGELRRVVGA